LCSKTPKIVYSFINICIQPIAIITSPSVNSQSACSKSHNTPPTTLSLSSHPLGKWTMVWPVLDINSVWHQSAVGPHWLVVFTIPLSEAPLATDMYLKQSSFNHAIITTIQNGGLWRNGRAFARNGFEFCPARFQITTLGRLLTRMCFSHQTV